MISPNGCIIAIDGHPTSFYGISVALYCTLYYTSPYVHLRMHIMLEDPRPYIYSDILDTGFVSFLTQKPRAPFMIVVVTLTSMPTTTL